MILYTNFFRIGHNGYWYEKLPHNIKVMVKQTNGSWRQVTDSSSHANAIGANLKDPFIGMDNTNMQIEIIWEPSDFQITIPEGSYTAENLAKTVESLMNKEVFNASADISYNMFPLTGKSDNTFDYTGLMLEHTDVNSVWYRNPDDATNWGLKPFVVFYDNISNKILIGSKQGKFTMNFSNQEIYDPTCDVNKAIFPSIYKMGITFLFRIY